MEFEKGGTSPLSRISKAGRKMRTCQKYVWAASCALLATTVYWGPVARAADAYFGTVGKLHMYLQSGSGTPVLNDFALGADAAETTLSPNSMTGGTVAGPNLSATALVKSSTPGSPAWGYMADYSTQASLDSAQPDGSYTLTLQGVHDGSHSSAPLSLTGDSYPSSPYVSN